MEPLQHGRDHLPHAGNQLLGSGRHVGGRNGGGRIGGHLNPCVICFFPPTRARVSAILSRCSMRCQGSMGLAALRAGNRTCGVLRGGGKCVLVAWPRSSILRRDASLENGIFCGRYATSYTELEDFMKQGINPNNSMLFYGLAQIKFPLLGS